MYPLMPNRKHYPEPTCWGKLWVMDLDCFLEELWLGSPCNLKPASWCANVASMVYGSATSLHRCVTIWFSVLFERKWMWSLLTHDSNVQWAKVSTGSSWLCLGCCLLRELVDHLGNSRWWCGASELQQKQESPKVSWNYIPIVALQFRYIAICPIFLFLCPFSHIFASFVTGRSWGSTYGWRTGWPLRNQHFQKSFSDVLSARSNSILWTLNTSRADFT